MSHKFSSSEDSDSEVDIVTVTQDYSPAGQEVAIDSDDHSSQDVKVVIDTTDQDSSAEEELCVEVPSDEDLKEVTHCEDIDLGMYVSLRDCH